MLDRSALTGESVPEPGRVEPDPAAAPLADRHSIGAGIYDQTAADPKDPYSGNEPYKIAGIPVADAVSFYYESEYALRRPGSRGRTD